MLQQTSQHGYLVTVIHTCVLTDITAWISGYCDTCVLQQTPQHGYLVTVIHTSVLQQTSQHGYLVTVIHTCVLQQTSQHGYLVTVIHTCVLQQTSQHGYLVTVIHTSVLQQTSLCVTDNSDMVSENGIVLFTERTEAQPGLPAAVSGQCHCSVCREDRGPARITCSSQWSMSLFCLQRGQRHSQDYLQQSVVKTLWTEAS